MGTVNLLEAVRRSDTVRVVVCITSDKCYENREWYWSYRESDRMGGHDPYSSSKGCAELVIASYRRSYFSADQYHRHGVAVGSTRAGNVIGGGDWAKDRLIPDTMDACIDNRPVFIRNPAATRPWQHVLEPLMGYLMLAERLWTNGAEYEYAQGWNFGPNTEEARPVSWIVQHLTKIWGNGARWESDPKEYPQEDKYLKLDCSKAKYLLGWSPKLDLPTTLQWIVEWYRAYLGKEDMRLQTESQINRYQAITVE
jgi:CDP-glucose 4,6-dehydratase